MCIVDTYAVHMRAQGQFAVGGCTVLATLTVQVYVLLLIC